LQLSSIATMAYEPPVIDKGYANQTLAINLSENDIQTHAVTERMKHLFVGGKGFDLWMLWQAVGSDTQWNDPENAICIASGPMGGTPSYPGSGKSIVTALSPLTGSVMDSNVGGYFGPYLKFAGFDAMQIQGKCDQSTIVYIDGQNRSVSLLRGRDLPEDAYDLSAALTRHFAQGRPRTISVVAAGPGARHTLMGCLNFTWYDPKRKMVRYKQAGRGGMGTVFEDKGLRALVVRWNTVSMDTPKRFGRWIRNRTRWGASAQPIWCPS
jgi:aldehyde:ferredoxin oxidoreductase